MLSYNRGFKLLAFTWSAAAMQMLEWHSFNGASKPRACSHAPFLG
jgi:hypothetical protein